MKWIKFISSLIISYVLGFILNKGLSATNAIKEPSEKGIEFLKYDIPFIYTIDLNEMFLVFSLTIILFLIFNCYYSKSKASKQQLFILLIKSLWIESVIFSFIIGTLTNKILKDLKDDKVEFFECFPWVFIILFFSLVVFIAIIKDYFINIDLKEKYVNDLYPTRKRLLNIIDDYLDSLDRLSIVGDWGVGKTKLIENFFYGEYFSKKNSKKMFKEKYSMIYIDVSTFCENKKIIESLERQLQEILKDNKILGINEEFTKSFFVQEETFLGRIYNLFIPDYSLQKSRRILRVKINEFNKITNKFIVICLDNIERIDNKERITSLLSMFDEVLSKNIKIIYLYDEKHMRKIFKKDQHNFDEYIEKYAFNKIKVNSITVEEILKEDKRIQSYFIKLKNRMNETLRSLNILLINHDILYNIGENKENFLKLIEKKINEINYKLNNPRFLIYLKEFIVKEQRDIYERLEYKIINYFFRTITLESIEKMTLKELINPNIFEDPIISKEKMNILVERKLVEYMFLAEENFEFTELNLQEKKAIYKGLFLNQEKKQINLKKEYFKIVKNIKTKESISVYDILNINKIMSSTNKKYKREVKKILKKYGKNINIIIKSFIEIKELLKIEGIEFYSEKKEIKILKNIDVDDDQQKEMVVMSALKYYFIEKDFFDNLFQFDDKQNYKEKIKIKKAEDLFKILEKENKEEFIKKVKEILEKHKIHINKINQNKRGYTYEALSKKLDFIEKIFNMEVSDLEVVLNDTPVQLYILKAGNFLYYSEDLLNRIIIKEDSMEFDLHEMERSFVLKRNHIKKMKKKLEELEAEEEVITSSENIRKFKRIKNIILSELYRFEKNI